MRLTLNSRDEASASDGICAPAGQRPAAEALLRNRFTRAYGASESDALEAGMRRVYLPSLV